MTRVTVTPYHASGAVRRHGVYHDRADCPDGSQIHSDHLAAGTGGLPRCDRCRALDEQASERRGG